MLADGTTSAGMPTARYSWDNKLVTMGWLDNKVVRFSALLTQQ